ncbi:hypothetical protein RE628_24210 [Paenibacillus sp. D2_2]|uniref:hypothetical protein n=1 Tax=Paenibacillus sp. D2_2 TaxID=3073092 RepID=UPI00281623BC|nr:hypothetical protein [Paenibacillus sp. D2_2]WMT40306.1 hypothetical protein RE628_24210 [Paenibacillus sp. D2_2]
MPETKPFAYCDQLVKQFEAVIQKPIPGRSSFYYTGVDLGTACVVLTVLDDTRKPVAELTATPMSSAMEWWWTT